MTPFLWKKARGIKEPLDEGGRGEWKSWLKIQHSENKDIASGPITSWQIDGETVTDLIFLGSRVIADNDCSHEIKRHLLVGRKAMTNLDSILKSRDAIKSLYSQSYGFSTGHVWMWELDSIKGWVLKNWFLWTMGLVNTLESLLDSKKIKPVNPKGSQPWIYIGRTDAEAPILWPPNMKGLLIGKGPAAGKDWRQKGTTGDEMVWWHHQLNGHEFEQILGDGEW